jgi:hypothetical protein
MDLFGVAGITSGDPAGKRNGSAKRRPVEDDDDDDVPRSRNATDFNVFNT